jgi:CBS domain-containing protein
MIFTDQQQRAANVAARSQRIDRFEVDGKGGQLLPEFMESSMKVSEAMTKDVRVANPNQTIREAAQAMLEIDAGVLPVGENDKLVGMITDRDIAVRGVAKGKGPDASVRDVMSSEVKYCFDDQDVEDVTQNMGNLQVRRLPVVDRDKRLVGILSLSDVAKTGRHDTDDALGDIARPGGRHSQKT